MPHTAKVVILRGMSRLWPAACAGVLLGAAIGGLALHAGTESEATALVRLHQPVDPDQIMYGTAPSAESEQSYISGEVTYLTSPGFANTVAKQLNQADVPRLSALQGVQSSVVGISATDTDATDAERSVGAALDVYRDHLQQQARERGQAAIDAITSVLGRLDAASRQAVGGTQTDTDTSDERNVGDPQLGPAPAYQQAIQQLVSQRLAIEAQTSRSASVEIVQPPTITSAAGAPGWTLGAVGGGLVGGLIALSGALAWRKRAGLITSPSALERQIEHVLSPTVSLGSLSETSEDYAGLSRSLYAQLPAPRSGQILLVGASVDSGTDEVARLIAFAASEHDDVQEVDLRHSPRVSDGSKGLVKVRDGVTVVIDGGSLQTSPQLPHAAENASQIIIVARIGRDVSDAVRMARQLARDSDIPVSAVCTRGRSRAAGKNTGKHQVAQHDSSTIDTPAASSNGRTSVASTRSPVDATRN